MHVATLLAAFSMLINLKTFWSSTLITCFQPCEETVTGARSMVFWMMESPCQSKVIQILCRYADAPIMAYTNEQTTAPKMIGNSELRNVFPRTSATQHH